MPLSNFAILQRSQSHLLRGLSRATTAGIRRVEARAREDMLTTYARLKEILRRNLPETRSLISRDADLFEDLEVDSIEVTCIAMDIEEGWELSRELTPDDFARYPTVLELVELINSLSQCPSTQPR